MISIKKNNKSLLVIGAGITGLSTGIHALLKGYNVEIFEKTTFQVVVAPVGLEKVII